MQPPALGHSEIQAAAGSQDAVDLCQPGARLRYVLEYFGADHAVDGLGVDGEGEDAAHDIRLDARRNVEAHIGAVRGKEASVRLSTAPDVEDESCQLSASTPSHRRVEALCEMQVVIEDHLI
jgi:hypothetical protein